jgi:glucose/arabinose dehydrogenase
MKRRRYPARPPRRARRSGPGYTRLQLAAYVLLIHGLAGCIDNAPPVDKGYGANPQLPAPDSSLLPTVNIAPAVGWDEGGLPLAAEHLRVNAFATGLDHPRWLYALPNGDILVAETNAPDRPEDREGLRGWIMTKVMQRAGAAVASANRITLLRDTDGDGQADFRSVFVTGLNSPFGMYLDGDAFYVANTDALLRFHYPSGATELDGPGEQVALLPAGPLNHHWTKNVIGSPDGAALFVTVGSNSNIAENGMDKEENRAAILRIDPDSGAVSLYASGLRNPNGLDWQPESGALWTTVNERDELGDNLVPDYMTAVKEGAFYGWPFSYYGQHVDERVQPQRPDLVARAQVPDYALGAHTASLGLVFYTGTRFPARYRNGAFIGQHGSWNRDELSGYKVIFIPFAGGEPAGPPEDILTGFVTVDGDARGRPVGVIQAGDGALLVADDVGNVIWRVSPDVASTMDDAVMQEASSP